MIIVAGAQSNVEKVMLRERMLEERQKENLKETRSLDTSQRHLPCLCAVFSLRQEPPTCDTLAVGCTFVEAFLRCILGIIYSANFDNIRLSLIELQATLARSIYIWKYHASVIHRTSVFIIYVIQAFTLFELLDRENLGGDDISRCKAR